MTRADYTKSSAADCWYLSTQGRDYKGTVNKTVDGTDCQVGRIMAVYYMYLTFKR